MFPLKLADRLAKKTPQGVKTERQLTKVKIYRGLPVPRKESKTNAAAQRQNMSWTAKYAHLVELHTRPLAYRKEVILDSDGAEIQAEIAREKGVDVELAIAMVRDSVFVNPPECEVAILFSNDTDFEPVLEMLVQNRGRDSVEVARWCDNKHYPPDPPTVAGVKLRQHLLDHAFYKSVEDTTSYGY